MQTSNLYEQEIRQRSMKSGRNLQNFFFLTFGVTLFALGGFMVSGMYAWPAFDIWLPLSLLITGLLLLSSKTYSIWLGVLFLTVGGLIWFHGYGLVHFPNLTRVIDWSFVAVGTALILSIVLRIIFSLLYKTRLNK